MIIRVPITLLCVSIACLAENRSAQHASVARPGSHSTNLKYLALCGPQKQSPSNPSKDDSTTQQAQAILKARCTKCHSPGATDGTSSFSNILDQDELIRKKIIVPGRPDESELVFRVEDESMPKDDKPLSAAEKLTLRKWIQRSAENIQSEIGFISELDKLLCISKDLETVEEKNRPFTRYFTLNHLHNSGRTGEIDQTTQAISKLMNHLSWNSQISSPVSIDPTGTILRIDIRAFDWTPKTWDLLVARNPYGVQTGNAPDSKIQRHTGTPVAHVRGDWFVFAAAQPSLYHDILGLPQKDAKGRADKKLQGILGIDVTQNIRTGNASRAGFRNSGVSLNNRIIEHNRTRHGAYWQSYDFAGNEGFQNIFNHPLDFKPGGGEIIFNLPNGCQGYMVIDGDGKRIDEAPLKVVSHPKRRRGGFTVINGLSCMECHDSGINPKKDQVRAHVEAAAFTAGEKAKILGLYRDPPTMDSLLREGKERFSRAMKTAGVTIGGPEPIFAVSERFEEPLDEKSIAAELGLTLEGFRHALDQAPDLRKRLAIDAAGHVDRETFNREFGAVISALHLGNFIPPRLAEQRAPTPAPDPVVPAEVKPVNDLRLICAKASGQFVVTRVADGKSIGKPIKFGSDCESALAATTQGIVCASTNGNGYSPFRIDTAELLLGSKSMNLSDCIKLLSSSRNAIVCAPTGEDGFLPVHVARKAKIGKHAMSQDDCRKAVEKSGPEVICSTDDKYKFSAFKLDTGEAIGGSSSLHDCTKSILALRPWASKNEELFCRSNGYAYFPTRKSDHEALSNGLDETVCKQIISAQKNGLICSSNGYAFFPMRVADQEFLSNGTTLSTCLRVIGASTPKHLCVAHREDQFFPLEIALVKNVGRTSYATSWEDCLRELRLLK